MMEEDEQYLADMAAVQDVIRRRGVGSSEEMRLMALADHGLTARRYLAAYAKAVGVGGNDGR
jgi:hypothetical protein